MTRRVFALIGGNLRAGQPIWSPWALICSTRDNTVNDIVC
jgi:hypothetical protein